MKPLFLVGYMGCGKSTLGRKLARRLGVGFVDTDALVEEQAGASVADVFRYEGEARFREAEREALERAIAAGGETVMRRYADSDPVIAAAAVCRAEMEPALDDLNPF